MKTNKFYFFAIVALLFQLPVLSASAQEAVAYLNIESQGKVITGSSTMTEAKNQIECIGYMYTAITPHDNTTGMATGRRTPGTVTIMKRIDVASPELMRASSANEVLQSVVISFYKRGPGGTMSIYQQVKLTNAIISQFTQYEGTEAPDKAGAATNMVEEITFSAQKIEFYSNDASANTGVATKGTVKTGYDLKTNKKQ